MTFASRFRRTHPLNPLSRLLARLTHAKPPDPTQQAQSPTARNVDISGIIGRALDAAGLRRDAATTAGGVRATIESALAQAGLSGSARDVAPSAGDPIELPVARRARADADGVADARLPAAGEFLTRSFGNAAGTRTYRLYVPLGYAGERSPPVPLIVMLHGCTQSPEDFAAGTRMNALADEHGFLVAYPEQTARANGSKCWNWFRAQDQARDRGEPSLIAGIAREVASDYRIDPRRIFVAGLSAGAAMAVILGETYPDVFAAVGAHSGLPAGAAHDVPSAFNAMKHGAAGTGADAATGVPTIVFHGDRDATVAPRNGLAIVRRASIGHAGVAPSGTSRLRTSVHQGEASGGRTYTREVFADDTARPLVESWIVHGASHAWSGGSAEGTYTDPGGPDASTEMVRFFLQQHVGRS